MDTDKDTDRDTEDLSSTIVPAGSANWLHYVKIFLPQERASEFSKEELAIEANVIKTIGSDTWNGLPKEIRLNIMRGYAHEKERLNVTCTNARNIYAWRTAHRVDQDALTLGPMPGSELYHACWPTRVAGIDVYGHPILYDRISSMDVFKLISMDVNDVYKYRTQALESLMYLKSEISAKIGNRVCKHVYVLDLAGIELKHFSSAVQNKLRPVMKMSSDMFPETLWTVWLINAPTSFRMIWNVVRGWLDPIIRAKVRMWGSTKSKWQAAMAECGVPVSALPTELGGSSPSESLQDILVRAAKEKKI